MDYITIELTSADPANTLQRLQNAGITLLDVESPGDFRLRFRISRADQKSVTALADKQGEAWKVLHHKGFFWPLRRLFRRPVLCLGLFLLLLVSLWVPSRVFFIQVEGNASVPTAQIVELTTECGISFGVRSRDIRSQQIKNALLEAIPSLQWAGINIKGCVAVISVRERSSAQEDEPNFTIGSVIAQRDGVIAELTVLRGIAQCSPGQAVKAGQVLISGYADCGICIRATQAEGDVYAYTNRVFTAVTPTEFAQKQQIAATRKKYSLIIGKKRINFANSSGNLEPTCAKIYSEKYVTLPGGFRLPIALVTETYLYADTEPFEASDPQALLQQFAGRYLRTQMQAGEVLQKGEVVTWLDGLCRLDGVYSCREMIGLFLPEENLPNYENN